MLSNILYLGITIYLFYEYIREPKVYKLFLLPLLVVSYLSNLGYLDLLDNRIAITIYILIAISTGYFVRQFYKDYKIKRVRERQRIRENTIENEEDL